MTMTTASRTAEKRVGVKNDSSISLPAEDSHGIPVRPVASATSTGDSGVRSASDTNFGLPADLSTENADWTDQYREELILDALSVVGSRADAEDVVQETFCEVLKDPSKLNGADSAIAMLLSINRCNALDRVRHKKRDSERLIRKFKLDPTRTETTGGFSTLDRADFIASAVSNLAPRMRAVVMLHYFQHQTYKQIAEQLNMPVGTVGRLLYEASKVLYNKLEIHVEKPQQGTQPKTGGAAC
jgi:RNA polymerase sigma-70 factor, ECF subfamily